MATATARSQQTPLQEAAERIGETVPGIHVAAVAVGLEDHRRMLADHARRVRSDYNRLHKQAGGDVSDAAGDDMGGNITITGDINVADARQANRILEKLGSVNGNGQQPQQPTQPQQPQSPTTWSKVWPWALAGGALASGAGIPAAVSWLNQPDAPEVVAPVEMPKYDVEKWTPPK
jgi:hypothetical protein